MVHDPRLVVLIAYGMVLATAIAMMAVLVDAVPIG